jgi:hypothetical protein
MTNDKLRKMLSRINILLAAAAIILQFEATGQTVDRTIKWDAADKIYQTTIGTKVKMPCFTGAAVSEKDGFVPFYGENISVPQYGKITATLSNEV